MKLHDLSPLVSPRIAVFPGDTPFSREVLMDFDRGDHLALSAIRSTVHLGAHADAPNHYASGGAGIADRPLDRYFGPCQVISVRLSRGARIGLADFDLKEVREQRVIFRTGSFPDPDRWNGDFNSLSPQLVEALAGRGVRLVGIDTPSVDPAEDKELLSHHAIARADMAVLEGLVLDGVRDGTYWLVAMPLRLEGCDASPVRAVLVEGGPWKA